MTILVSPNGDRYESHDPGEVNSLVLGHGYRIANDDAPSTDTTTVHRWGDSDPVRSDVVESAPTPPDPDSLPRGLTD